MTMQSPPVRFAESDQQKVERLIAAAALLLADLAAQLRTGKITIVLFIERATAELRLAAHEAAQVAGSTAAGADAVDELVDTQSAHLDGFAADIAAEKLSDKQIAARAALWAGLLHTSYQMAKGAAVEREETASRVGRKGSRITTAITWLCADDTSSCSDCSDLGEGGPYTFASLPTYPGVGVACGGNCRCDLEYSTMPADGVDFARGPAFALTGVAS